VSFNTKRWVVVQPKEVYWNPGYYVYVPVLLTDLLAFDACPSLGILAWGRLSGGNCPVVVVCIKLCDMFKTLVVVVVVPLLCCAHHLVTTLCLLRTYLCNNINNNQHHHHHHHNYLQFIIHSSSFITHIYFCCVLSITLIEPSPGGRGQRDHHRMTYSSRISGAAWQLCIPHCPALVSTEHTLSQSLSITSSKRNKREYHCEESGKETH